MMEIVKYKEIMGRFHKQLYKTAPLYITSDTFWDGGIRVECSLKEKAEFYSLAQKMSGIIKEIILSLNEEVFIGKRLCEYGKIYADWSDMENNELFCEISDTVRKNRCYRLSLPEDENVVDLIVESNFRYFTYISLYLPAADIVIQPTCHTEVIVYSKYSKEIMDTLEMAVQKFHDPKYKIKIKQ